MTPYPPGIDVSRWQGNINWAQVAASGQRFAFIKATEGSSLVDPFFSKNWAAAKSSGLLRGAYHFFRPLQDARRQVELFLQTAQLEDGDFDPVLDLEVNENLRATTLIQRVEIWVCEIEKATGRKAIIYSGVAFLNDYFTIPAGGPPLWAKDHLLWIANYLPPTATQPNMPVGWSRWTFWQHSQTGRISGLTGNVDLNWFNGSEQDLHDLAWKTTLPAGAARDYTIQGSDTWAGLATRFGVSIAALAQTNPQLLQPGTVIKIPAGESPRPEGGEINSSTTPTLQTYTVLPGDSLSRIAAKFNTTVTALAQANGISDPNQLRVGQVLTIPPGELGSFIPM
jgi:lysozyme